MMCCSFVASVLLAAFAEADLGKDGVVRIASADGKVEFSRVAFRFHVESDWKVLARQGEGLKAGCTWVPVGSGKTVSWYVLLHDGIKTYGFSVKFCGDPERADQKSCLCRLFVELSHLR